MLKIFNLFVACILRRCVSLCRREGGFLKRMCRRRFIFYQVELIAFEYRHLDQSKMAGVFFFRKTVLKYPEDIFYFSRPCSDVSFVSSLVCSVLDFGGTKEIFAIFYRISIFFGDGGFFFDLSKGDLFLSI